MSARVLNLFEADEWFGLPGENVDCTKPEVLCNPWPVNGRLLRRDAVEEHRLWLREIVRKGKRGELAEGTPSKDLTSVIKECLREMKAKKEAVPPEQWQAAVWAELRRLAELAKTTEVRLLCACQDAPSHADTLKSCLEWMNRG